MSDVRCLLITLFLSAFYISLNGQDFGYQVCLTQVSFSEDEDTEIDEYIAVRRDIGSLVEGPQYTQRGCEGNRNIKKPVAFISGGKINIEAKFETDCIETIFIRGLGPRLGVGGTGPQIMFPCKPISYEGSYTYSGLSDIPFLPNVIRYFQNFDIQWHWKHIDPNQTESSQCASNQGWNAIGVSSNPMYVTLRKFDPSMFPYIPYILSYFTEGYL